jgi:hypothetical protein
VIELLQFLFSCKVAEVKGICTKYPGTNVEEQYAICGKMENGVVFSMKNSTLALMKNSACIYGERGYVELPEYWKARKAIFCDHKEMTEEDYPCQHELLYEVRHIAECFQKGLTESPVVTGEFSANAIAVLEKVKDLWN